MEDFTIQTEQITKIKVALELNNNNIVIGYVYLASEDYTNLMANDNRFTLAEVDNLEDVVEYKTKYENGKLVQLDDFAPEYYAKQNAEQRRQELQDQLGELYKWFEEYDNQVKQYERDVRLGIVGTYHIGEQEYTIQQLDELATEKASQISAIRNQIA